ncbi:MAG: hypothetical protein GY754_02045 [bacterium]|nr:hypothetical protein [bacterium]
MFSIKQPVIYSEGNREENDRAKRYERSGLKEEEALSYIRAIKDYMETKKPFLDNELTIVDISTSLNLKRHYITQVLNEKLNINFNAYINKLRVKENRPWLVKKQLRYFLSVILLFNN